MKRKAVIFGGASLLIFMLWFGASTLKNLIKKERIMGIHNSLSLTLGELGTSQLINKPTVLFFFNSECEHCQWEVNEVSKNLDLFNNNSLLFVSFEPRDEAIEFLQKHQLSQYYLEASPDKVMSTFTGGVPQTFIYKNDNLVKHFKGEVKIEAILNALEN